MNDRVKWIDSIRGFAMYLVILGHTFVSKTNVIRNYIYSFHMPLFFFISGLTVKKRDISLKEYLKKRFKSILLPYIFINIFVLIIKYILHYTIHIYNNLNLLKSFEFFLKGYSNNIPCIQSWFLLCLFIIDILFFIIMKYTKNDKQLSIIVFIIFITGYLYSISNYNFLVYWHIDTALIGIIYYYFGYIFMKNIDRFKNIMESKKSLLIPLITLPLAYYLQFLNGKVSMNANYYNNIFLFLLSSLITIFSLVIIINKMSNKDCLFNEVGVMSIFFLGYHGFILTIIKNYIPVLLSTNILTIISSFITLILLFPLAKLTFKKCPILVGKL